MINQFIAPVSILYNEFAKANAVLQQAKAILSLEDSLSRRKRDGFNNKCSPELSC